MPLALLVSLPDAIRSKYGRRGIVWRTSAGSWLCCKSKAKKEGRVCIFSVRVSVFVFLESHVSSMGPPATVVSGCQSHIYSTPTEQASHFHGSWTRNVSPNSSTFFGVASLAMVFFGKRGWPTGFHQFHLAENWLGDHHDPPWSTILKDHERSKPMSSSSPTNMYVYANIHIYICVLYIHMYIILRKYAVFFWPAVSYTFGEIRQ